LTQEDPADNGIFKPAILPELPPLHHDHPDTLSFVVAIDDQIGAPAAWQSTTRRR